MALDRVIQAILEDGRKEADLIVEEGMKERARILGEANAEAERLTRETIEDAHATAKRLKAKELARADIEAKRIMLRAQKEVLDKVYALASERLAEISFVETIIGLKSSELTGSAVYCKERDKDAVMRAIISRGAKFGGTIECAGGLLIESGDRKVVSDYRLESILKDVWEESIAFIVTVLRGEK